jgi:hypothetical protein
MWINGVGDIIRRRQSPARAPSRTTGRTARTRRPRQPAGLAVRLRKEVEQLAGGLLGGLLRNEVADGNRTTSDILGPGPPDREWIFVEPTDLAVLAPEEEHRAADLLMIAVGFVLFIVECRGRPELLADRVRGRRVAELLDVLGPDLGGKRHPSRRARCRA